MINFVLLFIVFIFFVLNIFKTWNSHKTKLTFFILNIFIFIYLVFVCIDFKIKDDTQKAIRRTMILAYDVSASMDLDFENIKKTFSEKFDKYNIEFIPFSNTIFGQYYSKNSKIFSSLIEIYNFLNAKYKKNEIASLNVLTDGNETKDIVKLKDEPKFNKEYPTNVFYYSRNNVLNFDRQISLNKFPKFISRFNKEKINFIISSDEKNTLNIPVQLKIDGKVYSTTTASIKDGIAEGSFDLATEKVGEHLLEVSIPIDSREVNTANNTDYGIVEGVIDEFRVLHISGHPSPNTAYFRRSLQNIPGLDLISFYILRTARQSVLVEEEDLSLIPFPTDELFSKELNNFDLIISSDFNFNEYLSPLYLKNINSYINTGGNMLIFGGSNSFNAETISNNFFYFNNQETYIEDILPIIITDKNNFLDTEFKLVNSDISKLVGFSKLIFDLKLRGRNNVKTKDSATIFVEDQNKNPIIVGQTFGKGKVMTVLSDDFWSLSYNASFPVEFLAKTFLQYLLNIRIRPVIFEANKIKFSSCSEKHLSAKVNLYKVDGSLFFSKNISCFNSIDIKNEEILKANVEIEYKTNSVIEYSFYIYNEPQGDEFSIVPLAKIFLQNLAKNNSGVFLKFNKNTFNNIKNLESETKINDFKIYKNLLEIKYLLFIFLFLLVLSYYLKSRYIK